jgi:hypothetical protein
MRNRMLRTGCDVLQCGRYTSADNPRASRALSQSVAGRCVTTPKARRGMAHQAPFLWAFLHGGR